MQDTIIIESQSKAEAVLIAHTLRYRNVFALPSFVPLPQDFRPKGVILSQSNQISTYLRSELPILVLGEDAVSLCRLYSGNAGEACFPEDHQHVSFHDDKLFFGLSDGSYALQNTRRMELPDCLESIAQAEDGIVGFKHRSLPVYGLEYSIERNDPDAAQLLYNFAVLICGCEDNWRSELFCEKTISEIRNKIPEGEALCAVSGGVDSAVSAYLAFMAMGDRVRCVYIDTGFGRKGEADHAMHAFSESTNIPVTYVNAEQEFLQAFTGVKGWEKKEKLASSMMTKILYRLLQRKSSYQAVITGTNLNDLLYTGGDEEKSISSMIQIDPIHMLFKEEVRRLGEYLRLPEEITGRQPFPASGLAPRIIGEVTPQKLNILRRADACFTEIIENAGLDKKLFQYYVSLSDATDREGTYTACLRAVQTKGQECLAARLSYEILEMATERILTEICEISRVVYDLSPSVHFKELQ